MSQFDVYQMITDRLVAMLEDGTAPWGKPWTGGSDPANLVSRREYSGINYFLLACSSYSSPYWLTYKQAQDLGGHVRKGEKGTPVIFWKILEKKNATGEESGEKVPLLRYYTVFNAEQCEGIKVPDACAATHHNDPIDAAEAVQLAMPNRPIVTIGGARAFYSPARDSVTVPEMARYKHPEAYYSTLFHELGHSTGHETRLNRPGVAEQHFFGDAEYSREELVAEMAAAFLCGHCGIESAVIENSAAYLQSWIKALRGDKKLAITAAAQAQKAADYILNRKAAQADDE